MIITLPLGTMQANCYVLYAEESLEGVIIDPGGETTPLKRDIEQHEIAVQAILNTHGHFDHIAGNAYLQELDAPLGIHPADRDLLQEGGGASWFNLAYVPSPPATLDLTDGKTLEVGSLRVKVIHTPGHTPGSICLHVPQEQALFTGDTLFAGSVGRSDLPGGDARTLTESLKRLVNLDLPQETTIYPGHGPSASWEKELRSNPWLRRIR